MNLAITIILIVLMIISLVIVCKAEYPQAALFMICCVVILVVYTASYIDYANNELDLRRSEACLENTIEYK